MLEIKVNSTVYQVEIKVNKYGAILEIRKDDKGWYGKRWFQKSLDLYSINGSFNDYLTNAIQEHEQELQEIQEEIKELFKNR